MATSVIKPNVTVWSVIYPVGSIYMSVASTSPEILFGGTWEQLKDRFLLGAGDTYTAGDTGGSASVNYTPAGTVGNHTLTTAEIPSHDHTFTGSSVTSGKQSVGHTHTYTDYYATTTGNCALTVAQLASHTHDLSQNPLWIQAEYYGQITPGSVTTANRANIASTSATATGSGNNHNHSGANTSTTRTSNGISADHTHSVTASGSIGSKGGGGAHNHGFTGTAATIFTMPPYLAVYMWKRTA